MENTNDTISVSGNERTLQNGLVLPNKNLNIFVGPNNSGKSNILIYINRHFGDDSDYVSPQRLAVSNTVPIIENITQRLTNNRARRKEKDANTPEIDGPNPTQELACLNNKSIELLMKWHKQYFAEITIDEDQDYPFKAKRLLIEGRVPTEQGTGSRAVFSLLVKLFDPQIKILCIDEPEMSVEPHTQKKLFELIKLISTGATEIPVKRIFIATHSHHFVDRDCVKNNCRVYKDGKETKIASVSSEDELATIVFKMLGNSPGDLFFPSNIIIVEGESDFIYISKILNLLQCTPLSRKLNVRIHYADGDSRIPGATKSIDQMLKSVSYTPLYRDKLCVIFDKQKTPATVDTVKRFLGDDGRRVLELSKGGIEYFYPKNILSLITGLHETELDIKIGQFLQASRADHDGKGNLGSFYGTKVELATKVANNVSTLDGTPNEIVNLLSIAIDRAFE